MPVSFPLLQHSNSATAPTLRGSTSTYQYLSVYKILLCINIEASSLKFELESEAHLQVLYKKDSTASLAAAANTGQNLDPAGNTMPYSAYPAGRCLVHMPAEIDEWAPLWIQPQLKIGDMAHCQRCQISFISRISSAIPSAIPSAHTFTGTKNRNERCNAGAPAILNQTQVCASGERCRTYVCSVHYARAKVPRWDGNLSAVSTADGLP